MTLTQNAATANANDTVAAVTYCALRFRQRVTAVEYPQWRTYRALTQLYAARSHRGAGRGCHASTYAVSTTSTNARLLTTAPYASQPISMAARGRPNAHAYFDAYESCVWQLTPLVHPWAIAAKKVATTLRRYEIRLSFEPFGLLLNWILVLPPPALRRGPCWG